jgi:polysaccharide deacetylase family protein (PEP-CTERM system associated)
MTYSTIVKKETNKYAVLSMDVEDWYHLHYFQGKPLDKSFSMLDGFMNYLELLNKYDIKTTFFVLSEIIEVARKQILYASSCGHEIACHGKSHTRPLEMNPLDFKKDILEAKYKLSEIVGKEIIGYRAPCYSIDNERYEILQQVGFKYSSSKMDIPAHPLYGELDLSDFEQLHKGIYYKRDITEFALSTQKFFGQSIAVSGGGWIRLLPWKCFMKPLIKKHLETVEFYVLYIHPFELSKKQMNFVPGVSFLSNIRARTGLGKVHERIEELIMLLKSNGFIFASFEQVLFNLHSYSNYHDMKSKD